MIKDLTSIVKETTEKATEIAAGTARIAAGATGAVLETVADSVNESVTGTAAAAGAVAGMATGAAGDVLSTMSEITRGQFEQQVDTVLDLMETAARRTARRGDIIKNFDLSANLNLGIATIGLKVAFDPLALLEDEAAEQTMQFDKLDLSDLSELEEEKG